MSWEVSLKFIGINWASNAGKNILIKNIINQYSQNITQVISVKERLPKDWEIVGIDYNHYDRDTFEKWIINGEFIEYGFYPRENKLYVGTRIKDICAVRDTGMHVIKEIETQWLQMALESEIKDNIIWIFIDVPIEELKRRMLERDKKIDEDRMNTAKIEKEEFLDLQSKYKQLKLINGVWTPQQVLERTLLYLKENNIIV